MLTEGDEAPPFNLIDQDGEKHSLKEYKGKKVVLYFYPKDDTPGCTTEACSFRDEKKEFEKKNTVIFGVSADTASSHQKFSAKHGLTFPLLVDEGKEVIKAYGAWGPKKFMGKEFEGIIRSTFVIDKEGIIQKIFRNVRVDGHIEEVFNSL